MSYIDALIKLGQLDNARQILQQGKASGLTGDQIDRLEVQLSNTARSAPPFIGNATGPSKQQVDGLILLYTQGKLQDALAQGIALSNQFPDNPTILNVLGAVYAGLSRYEEAIINYNKVIEITPDFAEAYNNLGTVSYTHLTLPTKA